MPFQAFARILVALFLAAFAGCGGGSQGSPPAAAPPGIPAGAVLSITPSTSNVPPQSGQEILDAIQFTHDAGARGFYAAFRWNELEPQPGQFVLTDLVNALAVARSLGFTRVFVSIHLINTTNKETPSDLLGVAWDAPLMQQRFRALLDQVLPLLGDEVRWFGIGNEVDAWLGPRNEWAAYQSFFSQARAYAHTAKPTMQVGVATILDSARGLWRTEVQALNALADVAIFTYYGNDNAFRALPPSAATQALNDMVSLAAGKPVVVQEFGQSSSTINSGSEAQQAAFLAQGLATWSSIGSTAMPFFSVFALHDFPPALCDQLLVYYGTGPNVPFREYLCNLGLRRQGGAEKPAMAALRAFGTR